MPKQLNKAVVFAVAAQFAKQSGKTSNNNDKDSVDALITSLKSSAE